MANLSAIRSVGASLEKYFNDSYRDAVFPSGVSKPACTFSLKTIGGLTDIETTTTSYVVIFLYRVGMNQHLRNAGTLSDRERRPLPVSVDLHYLFTFWSSGAENEQLILAWTLRQLQSTTVLDRTILSSEAGWSAEEIVQLIPEEISTEEMMRMWDALKPNYRLSLSYIARVVRIDPDPEPEHPPVVASRFNLAVPSEGGS